MTTYWKFYLPEAHPTGLSGQVGGGITAVELEPKVGALFSVANTNTVSAVTQYRKVFAKQVEAGTFEGVTIELTNVEYTGQIAFAITGVGSAGDLTGFAPNAQTIPDVLSALDFSGTTAQSLTGLESSTKDDFFAVWLKQELAAGAGQDDLASFILKIRANKL